MNHFLNPNETPYFSSRIIWYNYAILFVFDKHFQKNENLLDVFSLRTPLY